MELKDVILSTLAEMDENMSELQQTTIGEEKPVQARPEQAPAAVQKTEAAHADSGSDAHKILEDERRYLESVKERLLVLFEGFQSPNNTKIEAKVDLTLNFLEYLLASIDTRLDTIKKSER